MSRQESHSSAGNYPADEQAGITQLSWKLSSSLAGRNYAAHLAIVKQMTGRNHAAHMAIVKQMSRQESRSSAGPDHVTEHALFMWLIIH